VQVGTITVDGRQIGIVTLAYGRPDDTPPLLSSDDMPMHDEIGGESHGLRLGHKQGFRTKDSQPVEQHGIRLGHKKGFHQKTTPRADAGNEGRTSAGDNPEFTARVDKMIAAAAKEGVTIGRGGGFRTYAEQANLHARKPGLAARPGHSMHEVGLARDLTYGPGGSEWAHKHASEYGLTFPMSYEPWHIQPAEGRRLLSKPSTITTGSTPRAVKGSWFSDTSTASGLSATTTPGIALPSREGLGKMHEVTGPNGQKVMLPQIDIGPAEWTGRGIDISKAALEKLGYTPENFPTDAYFTHTRAGPAATKTEDKHDPETTPRFAGAGGKSYGFGTQYKGTPNWGWHQGKWQDLNKASSIEDRRSVDKSMKGVSKQKMLINKFIGEFEMAKQSEAMEGSPSQLSTDLGFDNLPKTKPIPDIIKNASNLKK